MKTYEVDVEVKKRITFYVRATSISEAEDEAYEKATEVYDGDIDIADVYECEPEDDIEKYRE